MAMLSSACASKIASRLQLFQSRVVDSALVLRSQFQSWCIGAGALLACTSA
jgi:hypothetical protein